MSMVALAVLAIEASKIVEILGEEKAPRGDTPDGASWVRSLYGGAMLLHHLDDGALLDLGQSIRDVSIDDLGSALRAHLGPLLDQHDDDRGVFVFPEKARPAINTVSGIIEEVGELGEWAAVEAPQMDMGAMPAGLEAMMGQMLGGMDPSQMQGLFEQAQQMMADPAMAQQMMQAASQMMGGGLDMSALAEQAQQLAAQDPELVERLKQHVDGAEGDDEDDA